MRILLIATRSPYGQATGRKGVLRTIMRAIRSLGHELELAVFDAPAATGASEVFTAWLATPGPLQIAWNLLSGFVPGRRSLNEALYFSRDSRRRLHRLVETRGYDIVIADMLRTAQYADALGVPWILDLDDLLSQRYRRMQNVPGERQMLLGYFRSRIPPWLMPLASRAAWRLLDREADILERREVIYARRAGAVSLVSAVEATTLARRAGREVLALPMSVDLPEPAAGLRGAATARRAVFVGGLDYQPNLDAVRYFRDQLWPAIERRGLTDFELHVIGACPPAVRDELDHPAIVLRGYVEELQAVLQLFPVFLAPIVSGSGIKTKVVEAMGAGLPVLTTERGIAGLEVIDGQHCRVAGTPEQFADHLATMLADPDASLQMAAQARSYVMQHFSHEALRRRWSSVLSELVDRKPCAA